MCVERLLARRFITIIVGLARRYVTVVVGLDEPLNSGYT